MANTTPWRVSYKKQELRTLREHLSSPMYLVGSVLFIVFVFCVSYFVFRVVMSATISL